MLTFLTKNDIEAVIIVEITKEGTVRFSSIVIEDETTDRFYIILRYVLEFVFKEAFIEINIHNKRTDART